MDSIRCTVFIFSLLSFYPVFGQIAEQTPDQITFDEAMGMYYDEEYDSALVMFNMFLNVYPKSSLIPRAKYNIGYILKESGRENEAIPVFEELLEADYNQKESFGGIMEEYTLYKHRSASHLAEIYLDNEDYEQAVKYIRFFGKRYKYQHFCGNEIMASRIYMATSYARLYNGQGKSKKAIKQLLPYIFDNGLASNLALLNLLSELLEQEYSDEEIRKMVTDAKSSLRIKDENTAFINFFNTKIKVYDYSLYAIGNLEIEKNLELTEMEKWEKVFSTHPFFEAYIE